jgi:hypothetical protein
MTFIRGVSGGFSLTISDVHGNFCPVLFIFFFTPVGARGRFEGDQSVALGLGGATERGYGSG